MSTTRNIERRALGALALFAAFAAPALAQGGDSAKGATLYVKHCAACHGEKGDGQGPGAARLVPPPRDFTAGLYKFKSSDPAEVAARDEDVVRMIRDGMHGTAMPGWKDLLSEQDMRDVFAHLGTFVELEKPKKALDYGAQVSSSAESIERGRKLFLENDRCSECHGKEGKGDGVKSLKDDAGYRTWPRNLTKPWTFRASNDPKDIFARVSVGIPGTQMPAFADPAAKQKLGIEERWHIANYVYSLGAKGAPVRAEHTVVRAVRIADGVPATSEDPKWKQADAVTFALVPQLIAKERFFTPSNDTITVRALYDAKAIALLLEWDDRTKSVPGDEQSEKIGDSPIAEDSVAVQFPVALPKGMEKPYFGMGDGAHAVSIWQWKSGAAGAPQAVALMNARGLAKIEKRDAAGAGLSAQGSYRDGTWRVVMKRPLAAADPKIDLAFVEGAYIPVAFAAWDGSNGESGARHTMTTWYWLLLAPPAGNQPIFAALGVLLLVAGAQGLWLRAAAGRRREREGE